MSLQVVRLEWLEFGAEYSLFSSTNKLLVWHHLIDAQIWTHPSLALISGPTSLFCKWGNESPGKLVSQGHWTSDRSRHSNPQPVLSADSWLLWSEGLALSVISLVFPEHYACSAPQTGRPMTMSCPSAPLSSPSSGDAFLCPRPLCPREWRSDLTSSWEVSHAPNELEINLYDSSLFWNIKSVWCQFDNSLLVRGQGSRHSHIFLWWV